MTTCNEDIKEKQMLSSPKLVSAISLGLSLATVSFGAAAAEEAGWYFGVSAGQAETDISKAELDDIVIASFTDAGLDIQSASSSLDDSDSAWSLFGGYNFSPYVAVEVGYQDLGGAQYRSSGTVGFPGGGAAFPASLNFDFESKGFTLAALGRIPLGAGFDVHARLGAYFADSEVTITGGTTGFSTSQDFSANSEDLFYGVGAAFRFAGNWTIGLDYQLFKDVGDDEETGETDVDLLTLAVSYRL